MILIGILMLICTFLFIYFQINFYYYLILMIVISVFAIIRHREKIEKEKIRAMAMQGKENFTERVKTISTKFRDIKENSPFIIIVAVKILFCFWLINNVDSDTFMNYLFMFIVMLIIMFKVIEYLLDFKVFVIIDLENNTFQVRKMSYRLSSKYAIVDDNNNPSHLTMAQKTKLGEGYFANKIDTKNRIVNSNVLHNNVNLITRLLKEHMSVRKWALELNEENIKYKAGEPKKIMIGAAKIFQQSNLIGKLELEAEKTPIIESEREYEEELNKELNKGA